MARNKAIIFGFAAVLYGCLIFYFSSQSGIPGFIMPIFSISDKFVHFLEFALFGGLLFLAFSSAGWRPWDAALALALGILYGATDEVHQLFVPGRVGDPTDALVNCAGVIVAVAVLAFIDRKIHPSLPPAALEKA